MAKPREFTEVEKLKDQLNEASNLAEALKKQNAEYYSRQQRTYTAICYVTGKANDMQESMGRLAREAKTEIERVLFRGLQAEAQAIFNLGSAALKACNGG